jgi:hypothetical protein
MSSNFLVLNILALGHPGTKRSGTLEIAFGVCYVNARFMSRLNQNHARHHCSPLFLLIGIFMFLAVAVPLTQATERYSASDPADVDEITGDTPSEAGASASSNSSPLPIPIPSPEVAFVAQHLIVAPTTRPFYYSIADFFDLLFYEVIGGHVGEYDLVNILQSLTPSEDLGDGLEEFAKLALLPFSLIILFPLSVLNLIYGMPRGRILDGATNQPLPGALVLLTRDGHFVMSRVTDKQGYFPGFRLVLGEYNVFISKRGYVCQDRHKILRVTKESDQIVTLFQYLQPDTIDAADGSSYKSDAHPGLGLKLINYTSRCWLWFFWLNFLVTVIYTSHLNALIFILFSLATYRRISERRAFEPNVEGHVKNLTGQALPGVDMHLSLLDTGRMAGETLSDSHGRFQFFLTPGEKYRLSCTGCNFAMPTGDNEIKYLGTLLIDTNRNQKNLNLTVHRDHEVELVTNHHFES